jgi:glycosyltransferase involved in cell wall biosynthesis
MIRHEGNGFLSGFDDVDGLARQALRVLADPGSFRALGEAGVRLIDEKYSVDQTLPQLRALYEEVAMARV